MTRYTRSERKRVDLSSKLLVDLMAHKFAQKLDYETSGSCVRNADPEAIRRAAREAFEGTAKKVIRKAWETDDFDFAKQLTDQIVDRVVVILTRPPEKWWWKMGELRRLLEGRV